MVSEALEQVRIRIDTPIPEQFATLGLRPWPAAPSARGFPTRFSSDHCAQGVHAAAVSACDGCDPGVCGVCGRPDAAKCLPLGPALGPAFRHAKSACGLRGPHRRNYVRRDATCAVDWWCMSGRASYGRRRIERRGRLQVEAEWGDLTTTWQPADELLLDLEARKVELQVRFHPQGGAAPQMSDYPSVPTGPLPIRCALCHHILCMCVPADHTEPCVASAQSNLIQFSAAPASPGSVRVRGRANNDMTVATVCWCMRRVTPGEGLPGCVFHMPSGLGVDGYMPPILFFQEGQHGLPGCCCQYNRCCRHSGCPHTHQSMGLD